MSNNFAITKEGLWLLVGDVMITLLIIIYMDMRQHVLTDFCKITQGINFQTKLSQGFTYSFEITVNAFNLFLYFCIFGNIAIFKMTEILENTQFTGQLSYG